MKCLRCENEMNCLGEKRIQLGQTGWFLGDLPNLIEGSLSVEVYSCSNCGKIEFFMPKSNEDEIALRQCPKCGKMHEYDDPKCPFCKYNYYE